MPMTTFSPHVITQVAVFVGWEARSIPSVIIDRCAGVFRLSLVEVQSMDSRPELLFPPRLNLFDALVGGRDVEDLQHRRLILCPLARSQSDVAAVAVLRVGHPSRQKRLFAPR